MGKKYLIRYQPLPRKGDLKALAAARHKVSPVLLSNRLHDLDAEGLKRFARLAAITLRQAQRLRGPKRHPNVLSPEERQLVRDEWQRLIDEEGYVDPKQVTQEKLRWLLEEEHSIVVSRSTCSEILQGIKKPIGARKPRALC